MRNDTTIRKTLWLTAPANLVAAYMFAVPTSALGRLAELPAPVPPLYAGLMAFLVALFGVMYAWMALQTEIPRQLLALGAVGKAGVFVIAATLWLAGASSGRVVVLASGDLAFATLWTAWLRETA